jgi:hypothetical protein
MSEFYAWLGAKQSARIRLAVADGAGFARGYWLSPNSANAWPVVLSQTKSVLVFSPLQGAEVIFARRGSPAETASTCPSSFSG